MQCCRYFVYLVLIGGFTAVAVKIAVEWKITLRGLGDICRIFYENVLVPEHHMFPYINYAYQPAYWPFVMILIVILFSRIVKHFPGLSHLRSPWQNFAPTYSFSRKTQNLSIVYEHRIHSLYSLYQRIFLCYCLLRNRVVESCDPIFQAFCRDTMWNLLCNNRNVLLLWCGVWILIRS
jgi:hypothetical protein